MLVDAQVRQGILQRLCYGLSVGMIILLMMFSGLPIAVEAALVLLFLILNYWWYKSFIRAQAITEIWQQDSMMWCWRSLGSSKYKTAKLLHARYLGVVIHLNLQHLHHNYNVVIWRDQVSATEWRKLTVLTRLNYSQQNLL